MSTTVTKIHFKTVSSTNTWVKQNYSQLDVNKITRVTASYQTEGRGQFNRSWVSPKDLNIYVTYFFTLSKTSHNLCNLAQLLSLSITKLLQSHSLSPKIKWPNDVLIGQKKIAGVLCETVDLKSDYGIILGAGINVNMERKLLSQIDQPATSLQNETGTTYSLTSLLDQLDLLFTKDLSLYKSEGFTPFYAAYNLLLAHKGKLIKLHQQGKVLEGTLDSLSPDGRLNIRLLNGDIQTVNSGEIK